MTRPSVYGKVGCMSSSFWWAEEDFLFRVLPSNLTASLSPLPPTASAVYLDSGTKGSLGGEAQCAVYSKQVYEFLQEERGFAGGVNVFFEVDQGGEHNEASWGKRFHYPVETLYPTH